MFGNLPLHALIVHMPIALTVLVPLFVIVAFVMMKRGVAAQRAWLLPTGMLALLLASGLAAKETGEDQEDRVETIVPKAPFEAHEEAADLFMIVTGGVLVLAAGGLMSNKLGSTLRIAGAAGTLAVLYAGYNVGHSGGKLVYQYNAGSAYSQPGSGAAAVGGGDDDHR
jgi:uncharacterized membrane protein